MPQPKYSCNDCVVHHIPKPLPMYKRISNIVNTSSFRHGTQRQVVPNTSGLYTSRSGLRSTVPIPRNKF